MSLPRPYLALIAPQELDRDLHQLEGIVSGIAIDGTINPTEARALVAWCVDHERAALRSPFSQLVLLLHESISDGVLDLEERSDIEDLIRRCRTPNEFYNVATSDMQRLHGVLAGIGSDGVVSEAEARGLLTWLESVENLRGSWPYDEIASLITRVLADGVIDRHEQKVVLGFCREFAGDVAHLLVKTNFDEAFVRHGVCAVDPLIEFAGKQFCATGASKRLGRDQIYSAIADLGGRGHDRVVSDTNYLVVCDGGNRAWAFCCYGRKVEQAVKLRRAGVQLSIVHEDDFWDAVADRGGRDPRRASSV